MEVSNELLAILAFLVFAVNQLIDWFVTPIFEKYGLDKFWIKYIAWILGGILVFLTGQNAFADAIPAYLLVGRVLTAACAAILVGKGANVMHDATDFVPAPAK